MEGAPVLGGTFEVTHLELSDMAVHPSLMGQLQGLAPGTQLRPAKLVRNQP